MLTPFQIKKQTHFYNTIDFNHNGFIDEDDFEAIGENLCIIRNFDINTPEYDAVMAMTKGFWNSLSPFTKNGKGTLQQWLQFMTILLEPKNVPSYKQYIKRFVSMLFKLFDINDDQEISQTEYIDLFIGMRIEVRFAPKAFRALDLNGDGKISHRELIQSVDEFMRSNNPNTPGNWIFGGWESI